MVLLMTLQYTRQPTTKNHLAQDINSAKSETPCSSYIKAAPFLSRTLGKFQKFSLFQGF